MDKTILIIEDDLDMREVLAAKLEKSGYKVLAAKDGQEGWKKTLQKPYPRLVILDIILPILNGFDYLEMKRKNSELIGIPVIVLSNLSQKDDVSQCLKLGARDYIVKAHFTPDDLVERVGKYV
jgi:two-component system, chemotaxis family, sensor histidine kinase and response regulator PixL